MADKFYLDEDAFDDFARDLREIGKEFDLGQRELAQTLNMYTGAWGNDEIGKAFEKNYWENAEKVREGTEDAGEGVVDTARQSKKFAHYLDSLDEETARKMDKKKPE
jgi:hypothetical protein